MNDIKITVKGINRSSFVKEVFWVAYQASKVKGLGALQEREEVDADDVFENILRDGDYPGNISRPLHADYVFGRCMKLRFDTDEDEHNTLLTGTEDFHPGYQTFCHTYPKLQDLLDSAVKSLNQKYDQTVTYEITRS